mmetsp:Transcript_24195/g.38007  ORF Transcript_24195/g.38007 Transcript_24195/m.38007 type:complete len:294 (+) Transcript_24195:120-1001(+)
MFPKMVTITQGLILMLALIAVAKAADEPECKTFKEIYGNGKNLCENMWNTAFKYETDEDKAFTMWFFTSQNPNEAVADSIADLDSTAYNQGAYDTDVCHLDYFHKDVPGPEPEGMTECHPWKSKSCCTTDTVQSADKLKEGYGEEYHWDRCGPLSAECERFFVQEACFYECDPTAGLYRKYPHHEFDENNETHNTWEMHRMPIKASYCDAWYTACMNDKFCAADDGDYFSCAAIYKEADDSSSDKLSPGEIVAIVIPSFLAVGCAAFAFHMYRSEKAGDPVFKPIDTEDTVAA